MQKVIIKKCIIIFVVFLMLVSAAKGYDSYVRKQEEETCRKVIGEITYDTKKADEELQKLEIYIYNQSRVSDELLSIVNRMCSEIYANMGDFEGAIYYLANATHYAQKANKMDLMAYEYLDLAELFYKLNYYDSMIDCLVCLEENLHFIKDEDVKQEVSEKVKYNFARVNVEKKDGKKVLEYIEQPFAKLSSVPDFSIKKQLLQAYGYYLIGDFEKSATLVLELEQQQREQTTEVDGIKLVKEEELLYYRIKALLSINEKNLEEGFIYTDQLIKVCLDQELYQLLAGHLEEFLIQTHAQNIEYTPQQMEKLMELNDQLIRTGNRYRLNQTEQVGTFMLDYFFEIMSSNYQIDTIISMEENILKPSLFFLVILIVLGYILRKTIRKNRIDGLTGVYNRNQFDRTYEKLVAKKKLFYVLLFDIDYFKKINDSYGHQFGDKVLRELSSKVKSKLSLEEQLYRYGGEEFCVISKKKKAHEVQKLAETILDSVASMEWEHDLMVTVSIGVASSKEDPMTTNCADLKMYESKAKGRNQVTM